ncbi:DNA-binding protein [Paraburkholderia fungorum]|uniref:DNA-binding protein n=1 Tax=Paraburkholderia fungorum TaxID=134537 RepID=UPI0020983216|nr:DNA-binding protein [Paraburkholderia fungorum]USX11026.1 DNA-binding protein [Paraburkholderia fungorum]
MRPVEFTPEQIIEAGLALRDAGRNVTGFALRQRVGGGNPNRLKQVWDEHVAAQATTEVKPVAELPVEVAEEVAAVTSALSERIAKLAAELNDKAVKAAERRVAEVVRAAGEQREQAERELADAAQTVDDLEAQLDAATAETEDLKQRLADTQAHAQQQAVELAQLRERLAATEQSAKAAVEKHGVDLTRAQESVDRLRGELEALRASTAEKIEGLRTELAEVTVKAKAADQTYAEQRKMAVEEAARQAERFAQVQTERDAARQEAARAREDAAKRAGKLEALAAQNADLLSTLKNKG